MIPEKFIDTPIDYENIKKIDSIMGSGGMIVMDERSCMVDVSKFYLNFTRDESCGRCTPCRIGTTRMYEILEKISNGDANMSDLNNLWHLSNMVKATSLCGLGQSAPNPVISSMRNFMEEYESHALGKTCPAGKCKALLKYSIDAEKCIGDCLCQEMPRGMAAGSPRQPHVIDQEPLHKMRQLL